MSSSVSGVVKDAEHEAVVCVLRSACERVTEREEFVGRLSEESRFPQYLQRVSNEDRRVEVLVGVYRT